MREILNLSRRGFLKAGLTAGGGLILGVHIPGLGRAADAAPADFAPNAYLRIAPDDMVTVFAGHSELGQGVYTSLALLVAEDLEADWSKMRVEGAPVDPAFNHSVYGAQMTGGSSSTWSEWDRLRKAGAAARLMLIAAAAETWNVEPTACRAENGQVVHPETNRRLSYGKLVEKASHLKPPQNVTLKDPKDFKRIGKATKRLDTPDKTTGKAVFGLDVTVPGMLVAVVARPPVFGGKVKSFNAEKAKAVPGVRHVVQIEPGVAVVADGFWPAKLGREALEVVWDDGPLAGLDSRTQGEHYAELAQKPQGVAARKEGDAAKALDGAAQKLDAVYELPYLAHATMEPMNAVADVRADSCEVWTGTQFQSLDRDLAARSAGLKPEQVRLHSMLCGGGFGRRAVPDSHFVCEAVQTSKAVKAPVKVVWTREDDMHGGFYRPRAYHAIRAGLDAAGALTAWRHRVVCQSFLTGTPFESLIKDGLDDTAVEGAKDIPYQVPNLLVDWQPAPGGVPTLWWRSVGHSHNGFVVECFLDEAAHAAGKDPLEFRRALLPKDARQRRALDLAAEKAGWGTPLPEGRGRGLAVHESFGSFVADVAEVSVSKDGRPRVHRVVCAIDCGPTVNPSGIEAQMESGIVFGLTAALYGEITFEKGRVKQRNFHDYRMLRINEMPTVEVHVVPSTDKMGGVGEPGVPPVAPAVCNAIFAATGKRIRRLPIRAYELKTG